VSIPAFAQVASDVQCTACVGVDDLAASSVDTSEIVNGGVRTPDLGANSVTSGKIKNGEVAFADLSPQVQDFMGASIANISLLGVVGTGTYVAGAQCPSDRIPVAPSCSCDGGASKNLGLLVGCVIAGDGAIAVCQIDSVSYDPLLDSPEASAKAICLGATSADGTPWDPVSSSHAPDTLEMSPNSNSSGSDVAAWRAARHAAYESKLAEMKARLGGKSQTPRQ